MGLKTTTSIVKEVLEAFPKSRNSDNVLYVKVCEKIAPEAIGQPFCYVLPNLKEWNLPSLETVGRCRRKIVENHPELAGDEEVELCRMLNEEEFREYAREVIV